MNNEPPGRDMESEMQMKDQDPTSAQGSDKTGSENLDPCGEILAKTGKPKDGLQKYVVGGLVALLTTLFIVGFLPRLFQTRKIDGLAAQESLPTCLAIVATPEDTPVKLVLPSSTAAHHITPIWARTNGYLTDLLVDIGDEVEKGQLLSVLDTPEIDQEYWRSIGEFATAESKRDIAKISNERWQELYKIDPATLSRQEVDERLAAYIGAEAEVRAACANMQYYRDLMDFKYIVAPFKGIITERNIDLGSLITAGSNGTPQQLFVIAKTDIIRVFVDVPQNYFRNIREGVEGDVTIREYPGKTFKAKVVRYAKALDPTARTLLTELHIDNKDGQILIGLYADVTFTLKPEAPYYIVPVPAVIIRSGDPKIAVLDEHDVVHLKPVTIGVDFGKTIQIIDGLQPNERIVANPSDRIKEGVKVKVIEHT